FKITLTRTGDPFRSPPTTASSVVTAVHPNSQAEAAGIQPGDVVLFVSTLGQRIQPSYPQAGPQTSFEDPTIQDILVLLQDGLNVGSHSMVWGFYRPSSSSTAPIILWLQYPIGYDNRREQRPSDSHQAWLRKAQLDRQHQAGLPPDPPPAVPGLPKTGNSN